ncbi:MAG: transposase [Leptospirales bacterium]
MTMRGVGLIIVFTIIQNWEISPGFILRPSSWLICTLFPERTRSCRLSKRGGITKSGNGHVRRALVESAWTYRFPARKSRRIQKRMSGHLGDTEPLVLPISASVAFREKQTVVVAAVAR